jgi:ribosomal protein S18 acetylase RimI-like enzyme
VGTGGTVSGMDIEVRRAEPEEWATARRIRLAALADAPGAFGSTLDREVGFEETLWRERLAAWPWLLAWLDGEPVGLVAVRVEHPAGGRQWHLGAMWVSPQVRGSGVADRLVDAATARVRAAGGSAVTLWVAIGNARARGFYQRMGFRSTGIRQVYQRPGAADLDEEELTLDLGGAG